MLQSESNQEMFGQPAKYWRSYSFCPVDDNNVMYTEHVKNKLVSYLEKNTDFKLMNKADQKDLIESSVRRIRIELNALPKFLQKKAA